MLRNVIKKVGVVLLAAGLSIGMFSPSVSAAVKINKAAQMKAAKNVEPEEWNKEELTAYQFDSEVDMMKYLAVFFCVILSVLIFVLTFADTDGLHIAMLKPAAIRTAPIFLISLLAIEIPPYILIWINNTLFHTFHLFSL